MLTALCAMHTAKDEVEMSEKTYQTDTIYCQMCGRDTPYHICDSDCPADCKDSSCLRAPHENNDEECEFRCGICGTPNLGGRCVQEIPLNIVFYVENPVAALSGETQRSLDALPRREEIHEFDG